MAKEYLDKTGLTYFWGKLKTFFLNLGVHYGTCSTAAGTAQKEVTIDGVTELSAGVTVAVKFTNANSIANPTLKVNSLDAKAIKRYGTTAPSTSAASSWNAGSIVTFTYDGSYWQMHDWNNTTYSAMSESEMKTGTAGTARTITAARLKQAVEYHAPKQVLYAQYGTTPFSDITQAIDAGKDVICASVDGLRYYQLALCGGNNDITLYFYNIEEVASSAPKVYWTSVSEEDVWSNGVASLQKLLVSGTSIKTINNQSLLGSGNIDIQGGTVTPMTDQEIEDAVDAGWVVPVTPNTVTISLTNPRHSSSFMSCPVYGLDIDDPVTANRTLLGTISSPTGSIEVEVSQPFLMVDPTGPSVYGRSSGVSTSGDVTWDGNDYWSSVRVFAVTGSGSVTIDGVDYDF